MNIVVEDHAVPQLLTSALEAYDFGKSSGRRYQDKLETFGLLWGYIVPERPGRDLHVIASFATVETSALCEKAAVTPRIESLKLKADFIGRYWPHLEVVGTFHSHPYSSLEEVNSCKGWRASTPEDFNGEEQGDTIFWPWLHEQLFPQTPYLAHLIITITGLQKKGWAYPEKIESGSGYVMSAGDRKLWIMARGTKFSEDEGYQMTDEKSSLLDIPSLQNRFLR